MELCNDPEVLFKYGQRYLMGDRVPESDHAALVFFKKAVDKGHADAAVAYNDLLSRLNSSPNVEYVDKYCYSGDLLFNNLTGDGKMCDYVGNQYEGHFINGIIESGSVSFSDDNPYGPNHRFVGKFDGSDSFDFVEGTYYWPDGSTFEGRWDRNGQQTGVLKWAWFTYEGTKSDWNFIDGTITDSRNNFTCKGRIIQLKLPDIGYTIEGYGT